LCSPCTYTGSALLNNWLRFEHLSPDVEYTPSQLEEWDSSSLYVGTVTDVVVNNIL